jgi:hypothetical protein
MRIDMAISRKNFMRITGNFDSEEWRWTIKDLLEGTQLSGMDHLENLILFANERIYFPTTYFVIHPLQASLRFLVYLEFDATVTFKTSQDLEALLCSLPQLEELVMSAYNYLHCACYSYVPGENTAPSLRRLTLADHSDLANPHDCLLSWLATTGTPHSLTELTVHDLSSEPGTGTVSLHHFLVSMISPLSLFVYFGICKSQIFQSALDSSLINHIVEVPEINHHLPGVKHLEICTFPTDTRIVDGGSIKTDVVVQRCLQIHAPLLRNLHFIFPPHKKNASFEPLPPLIHGIPAHHFPLLSNVYVGFHDGSNPRTSVQRVHDCRYFRDAFPAVDVTFSEEVMIHN